MNMNNLAEKFVFYSIVFGCFNGLAIIRGFSLFEEGFFYFATLGMFIFLLNIKNEKLYITDIVKLYTCFFIWSIFVTLVNIDNIMGLKFKSISAEYVMVKEIISFVWLGAFILFYTKIFVEKSNIISWIYKGIKISFYITLVFVIIQGLAMAGYDFAMNLHILTQKIVNVQFTNRYELGTPEYLPGLFGATKEQSSLGNYISVVFPWLVLGMFSLKKEIIPKVLCILSIVCVIFSYSRIAYGTLFIELILMIVFVFNKKIFNIKRIFFSIFFMSIIIYFIGNNDELLEKIVGVFLSFSDEADIGRMASNITRLSMQVAAVNMFFYNPLGMGIGQYAFHAIDFLPSWAYLSPEMVAVISPAKGSIMYGSYNTHLRVLAELGIVGFIIWVITIIKGIKNYLFVLKNINKEERYKIKLIIISYIISLTGFINFDIYVFFYYWMLLILSSVLVLKIKKGNINN